jgi:arylsulfatase A
MLTCAAAAADYCLPPLSIAGDSLGLIDRSAGRFMNLTKELQIDEDTLMIFSADNGGSLAWRELGGVNGDLRCGKGTTYEGGHRVPSRALFVTPAL